MTDVGTTTQRGSTIAVGGSGRRRINPITVLIYTLLVVLAAIYIYPFLVQLATSFKTDPDAASNPISLVPDPSRLRPTKSCSPARVSHGGRSTP
jgi:ABC-type glycerol-3-phosphate transport system permease component